MNPRIHVLLPLTLCCASAFAQQDSHTTTFETAEGPLTVTSGQPAPRSYGPPPSFAQLDRRGAGYLTGAEADAYPPLGNDFIYADSNRDGRISKAEYDRWAAAR